MADLLVAQGLQHHARFRIHLPGAYVRRARVNVLTWRTPRLIVVQSRLPLVQRLLAEVRTALALISHQTVLSLHRAVEIAVEASRGPLRIAVLAWVPWPGRIVHLIQPVVHALTVPYVVPSLAGSTATVLAYVRAVVSLTISRFCRLLNNAIVIARRRKLHLLILQLLLNERLGTSA